MFVARCRGKSICGFVGVGCYIVDVIVCECVCDCMLMTVFM